MRVTSPTKVTQAQLYLNTHEPDEVFRQLARPAANTPTVNMEDTRFFFTRE